MPTSTDISRRSEAQTTVFRLLLVYTTILFGLFVLNSALVLFARFILHLHYPYNNVFFQPGLRFTDWTNFTTRVAHHGETDMLARTDLGYPYPYPLTTVYLFLIPVRLTHHTLAAYRAATICIFGLTTFLLAFQVRRMTTNKLPQAAIWFTLLLGFPAWFLYNRGNIEVFVWLFMLLGLAAYLRRWNVVAALLFALAGSMKIYPTLFLLLFLPRKHYTAFAFGLVAVGVFSISAIADMGPSIRDTIQQMHVSANFLRDHNILALNRDAIRFDHSIFALAKHIIYTIGLIQRPDSMSVEPTFPRLLSIYSILAPLSFLLTYLLRLRKMPLLNQFLAISLLSILLPYVSYEYTLVQVYTMLGVVLLYLLSDVTSGAVALSQRRMTLLMTSFAFIIAPVTLIVPVHYPGQAKCLVMLMMVGIILATPMPSSLFGDLEPVSET